jgi:hypothetical protein
MSELADSNRHVLSLKADLEAAEIARDSAVDGIQESRATVSKAAEHPRVSSCHFKSILVKFFSWVQIEDKECTSS